MGHTKKFTDQGEAQFFELAANGANKIALRAPSTLAADVVLELPPNAGTSGYLLRTDGVSALTWTPSTGTEEFAQIVLLNQGRISLRELTGNGTNFVGFRAPAALAASIDFTMPAALPGSTLFLSCDTAGQWAYAAGTSTIQSAYDAGAVLALTAARPVALTQAADEGMLTLVKAGTAGGVLATLTDAGTGGCLSLIQNGNAVALTVAKAGGAANAVLIAPTGAFSGAAARITMPSAGSGIGLDLANDGSGIGLRGTQATTAAILAQLNQGTISHALDIQRTTAAAATLAAVDISDAATSTGSALNISKEAGSGGSALTVNQGNVSTGAVITQSTNGIAARIVKSGTGAGNCVEIENDGLGRGLNIQQDGPGSALWVTQSGTTGSGLSVVAELTPAPAITILHTGGDVDGYANDIQGSNVKWFVSNNGVAKFNRYGATVAQQVISAGAITLNKAGIYLIDTEAAAAADDLTDILSTSGDVPVPGQEVTLSTTTGGRVVTVKVTGNIRLAGGVQLIMDNPNDMLTLIRHPQGTNLWVERSRQLA